MAQRRTSAKPKGDEQPPAAANGRGRRNPARKGRVETELYDTAAALFAERGYSGTSLQDIAEAMGMTRPALYTYVASKEQLLAKLVAEITEGSAAGLAELGSRKELNPVEKLRQMVTFTATFTAEKATRFQLIDRSEAQLPAELAQVHRDAKRKVLGEYTKVISEGISSGHFRPVEEHVTAFGIIGMCNWIAWWFRPDSGHSLEATVAELADFAVRGLVEDHERESEDGGLVGALADVKRDIARMERLIARDRDT